MPPITLKIGKFRFRSKIAAFDYDWTLIKPLSTARIPKNIDDWQWISSDVPIKLKEYYDKGFCIVVFTNQSKQWKVDQIKLVLSKLDIPVYINIAMEKIEQKPNTIMFDLFTKDKKWNNKASFFVGDALGRKCDWSDTDKQFAQAIGINIKSPEEIFNIDYFPKPNMVENNIITSKLKPINEQEIIIMTGYPGSGKSTLVEKIFGNNPKYIIIHGDDLKTSAKMVKAAIPELKNGKSVIFDATNPSKAKRADYIKLKDTFKNIKIRCIYVSTSIDESMKRNKSRPEDKIIPNVVFYIYIKKFEEPSEKEGCEVIII